ncbi:hypothetical protein [Clostridium tagluense]|uniref:hypothetical protein n=1 Tax=Clostridium tagluense TaxID=360422 RepID=UPI001C6EA0F7|nr:hypothetical protein [Clostridium tagluense]MBW9159333.1 hypothetical protein [Clostridium tagluense]WLC68092.1 hypothetical protein KTC93_24255 [Clostridium tagluense]
MNKYCQIYNGKSHWIFESETVPEFASNIIIKNITSLGIQPKEGWDYDLAIDKFTAPVIVPTVSDDPSQSPLQLTILEALQKQILELQNKLLESEGVI